MNRNLRILCLVVLTLAILGVACSSAPPAKESSQSQAAPDRIQGKAQVLEESGGASDAALNAGGSSVYIWEGIRRYRLFLRTTAQVVHGNVYVVEGINAQKAIDEIGDPDQGKHGYPLQASCERIIGKIWSGLAMDEAQADATVLRGRIQRYPARPVFLVKHIRPATASEIEAVSADEKNAAAAGDENVPEVTVPAEKQRALLMEGPTVLPAPLWEPEGGTVLCRIVIGPEGKIADLETGKQLCESVPWAQFRYQPPVQGGHKVKVDTEVEVKFEARK